MEIPIVGFRRDPIKYYWINEVSNEVIVIIRVYKRYTIDDIKYPIEIDPNINEHLKSNFERELLIQGWTQPSPGDPLPIKYLRFPAIDYLNDDVWDDLLYAKERDNLFYLAKSKDPMYRMLANTEARDGYIDYLQKVKEKAQYKCFPPRLKANKIVTQIKDQTLCEQANALWVKQCETDTDCPYIRGGCDRKTGYCRMPVNVKPLTYRQPANPESALCYNCQHGFLGKDSIGQCCHEQQPDPDYLWGKSAFGGLPPYPPLAREARQP